MTNSERREIFQHCWEFSSMVWFVALAVWVFGLFWPVTVRPTGWLTIKSVLIYPTVIVALTGFGYFLYRVMRGQSKEVERQLEFRIIRCWAVPLALAMVIEIISRIFWWNIYGVGFSVLALIFFSAIYSAFEMCEAEVRELEPLKLTSMEVDELYLVTTPVIGNLAFIKDYGREFLSRRPRSWRIARVHIKRPLNRFLNKVVNEVD